MHRILFLLVFLSITTACFAQKPIHVKAVYNKRKDVIVLKRARKTTIDLTLDSVNSNHFKGLQFAGNLRQVNYTLNTSCGCMGFSQSVTKINPLTPSACIDGASQLFFDDITIGKGKRVRKVADFTVPVKYNDRYNRLELKKP